MAKFRFYQDVEVVTTRREYFNVTAESLEDARAKASEVCSLDDLEDADYVESELLLDDIGDFNSANIKGIYDSEDEEIN